MVRDGEHIEQGLGGVLAGAIAGIEDHRIHALGKKMRSSRRFMPNHNHIGFHRLDILGRVFQRFPFGNGRAGRRKIDRVC